MSSLQKRILSLLLVLSGGGMMLYGGFRVVSMGPALLLLGVGFVLAFCGIALAGSSR